MKILFNELFLNYNQTSKYEGAYRISQFKNKYKNANVMYDPTQDILKVHSRKYYEKIKRTCAGRKELVGLHLTPEAFDIAKQAVAYAIEASQTSNFSIARPPGHHASSEKASGFCIFNNMAIAVNKLLEKGVKVAVLDIDGHHGDGTEKLLKNKNNVLFCSIHEHGVFPGTGDISKANYINFPLFAPIDEESYLDTLEKATQKILSFEPDILGLSVGFDTFKNDALLHFDLEIDSYRKIGVKLRNNFKNMFAVLEGGYHNNILECAEAFLFGVNTDSN